MLGTAHFTRRSLLEAYKAVTQLRPTDLAIELDMHRFRFLNQRCAHCSARSHCAGSCEFVGATEALGNIDACIWLIDMSEREIAARIRRQLPPSELWRFSFAGFPPQRYGDNDLWLWENGHKEEVMHRHAEKLQALRARAPHVWRVLIDERNAVMAARLAWIVTGKLNTSENVKVLALTGAAHVEGIKELLETPVWIKHQFQKLGLRFTPPTLIRRVGVN